MNKQSTPLNRLTGNDEYSYLDYLALIGYSQIKYSISKKWSSKLRWFILRRLKFSPRYKLAKIIGWPEVVSKYN